jgi:hypothetical protein
MIVQISLPVAFQSIVVQVNRAVYGILEYPRLPCAMHRVRRVRLTLLLGFSNLNRNDPDGVHVLAPG